jgi:glycosyltransferase involved in cell wall biosynthesis
MRVLLHTEGVYRERGGTVYGDDPFARFVGGLNGEIESITVVGRLADDGAASRYALPADVHFIALPFYQRLSNPLGVARTGPLLFWRMWRSLDDCDVVWALGPHPTAVLLAALGLLRRRPVVLGVRQDFPTYVRNRHPDRRGLQRTARGLERVWKFLARRCAVIAVGSELAESYGHSRSVLPINISLIDAGDIDAGAAAAAGRRYDADLTLLSVGRLDTEKNPLLLADVLKALRERDPRWRLIVCGEGTLADQLAAKFELLGLSDRVELRGFVADETALLNLFRASHVFLHVSLTEGMPQVLIEAFASGLPTVATAVGGVVALGGVALLVAPADADAAAGAVEEIVQDSGLRERLIASGLEFARNTTLDVECSRVAAFLREQAVA